MGASRKSATSTQTGRVVRAVEEEFTAAAAARWGTGAEVFLWRSRRCVEALLYALLLEQGADLTPLSEAGKGLDELSKHGELKGLIPREMRDHIEGVRKYGNTGTHFQVDGDVSETSAAITASALSALVRWFYTREGKESPAVLAPAFAALADSGRRIRSEHELALDVERGRTQQLTRTLDARQGATAERAPRRGVGGALVATSLLVTVGALGFAVGRGSAEPPSVPAPHAQPPVALTPTPPSTPAVPVPARTPIAPAPTGPTPTPSPSAPTPSPPPPPLRCTERMVRVGDGAEAFCIDAAAVTTGDYRRCVADGSCTRPPDGVGCNWQSGPRYDVNAANCVPRELADAYCRWSRAPAGSLPTRAEWERVRPGRRDVQMRDDTNEWTADDAPGDHAWVRGPRSARGYSWTTAPAAQHRRDLSFRCAVR